eukprot:CAMPEP_0177238978 /NCGR_PEP_ID=MMETSP0367-20130122/46862_1 /TAXON_ID=447022 ORGANISM="Scrippsiella hangoei-like, Strain SHHI-4" /NCGR_SAMPLE_ID=MMETSP0367 /ASSEMBLY_ACC=CAM_ASM_000362 /LENGTH=78 /DNA_ID=CAMNT_0018690163 /DNA_START=23 /DNA_END=255 /DNA_ORIENTATION=-
MSPFVKSPASRTTTVNAACKLPMSAGPDCKCAAATASLIILCTVDLPMVSLSTSPSSSSSSAKVLHLVLLQIACFVLA